jgi:hypothetical protein
MVRDLVQHDVPDLAAQQLRVVSVEPFERATIDRDLVRKCAGVVAAPSRERHALVEPEQRPAGRRLVFDDDLDVRDPAAKLVRKRVERVLDDQLEVGSGVVRGAIACGRTT